MMNYYTEIHNQIILPSHELCMLRLICYEKTSVVYVILFWHVIKELEVRLNKADWACSTRVCQCECTQTHTHLSYTPGTASYLPFGSMCVSTEHKSADELKMRENAKSKQ